MLKLDLVLHLIVKIEMITLVKTYINPINLKLIYILMYDSYIEICNICNDSPKIREVLSQRSQPNVEHENKLASQINHDYANKLKHVSKLALEKAKVDIEGMIERYKLILSLLNLEVILVFILCVIIVKSPEINTNIPKFFLLPVILGIVNVIINIKIAIKADGIQVLKIAILDSES
jgi:hypothetical protein